MLLHSSSKGLSYKYKLCGASRGKIKANVNFSVTSTHLMQAGNMFQTKVGDGFILHPPLFEWQISQTTHLVKEITKRVVRLKGDERWIRCSHQDNVFNDTIYVWVLIQTFKVQLIFSAGADQRRGIWDWRVKTFWFWHAKKGERMTDRNKKATKALPD